MAQTLGKRIAEHRKRLGMTQDALAEKLGITAQAVSKWENDLSCPDISVLPKLAEIFGITTDELLGMERKANVHNGEVVDEEDEDHGIFNVSFHPEENDGKWSFHWDSGRRQGLGFACWVLLLGGLMLADNLLSLGVGFWSLAWPSFLLMIGLFGKKHFSLTSLGFVLLGGYFLADNLSLLPDALSGKILWPAFVILFGLSLLIDALRKPNKSNFQVIHNGGNSKKTNYECTTHSNSFECDLSFGEQTYFVESACLEEGEMNVNFGDLTVDLSKCPQVAPDCRIEANCVFGHLVLRVPRRFMVEQDASTAFGSIQTHGQPDENPIGTITLDASASFGEISIRYI